MFPRDRSHWKETDLFVEIDKLSDSRLGLSTMYETEQDANTESTTQGTASCPSLNSPPAMHNPIATTSTTSTNQVDLNILRSSMSGDPSQVCVFGTGLYEAKPRRKASFKIDASQAGLSSLNRII